MSQVKTTHSSLAKTSPWIQPPLTTSPVSFLLLLLYRMKLQAVAKHMGSLKLYLKAQRRGKRQTRWYRHLFRNAAQRSSAAGRRNSDRPAPHIHPPRVFAAPCGPHEPVSAAMHKHFGSIINRRRSQSENLNLPFTLCTSFLPNSVLSSVLSPFLEGPEKNSKWLTFQRYACTSVSDVMPGSLAHTLRVHTQSCD